MRQAKKLPLLDDARVAAAILVAAIHTSPLASVSADADFWLTRVLARLAVPFFFLITGYFLGKDHWRGAGAFCKKMALLYLGAVLLYLPLNIYNGGFPLGMTLTKLFIDGTFYHLWYFPAVILGVTLVSLLRRLGNKVAFAAAGLLYLVGLGGDSYYGFFAKVPWLKAFYDGWFSISGYTRGGLFFAPLFLLLGAAAVRLRRRVALPAFLLVFVGMTAEAFWLHQSGVQHHDSMYLLLPLCAVLLFSLLFGGNAGRNTPARSFALWFYLLHPWGIVLVRGIAKGVRLQAVLLENSVIYFLMVLLLGTLLSVVAMRLVPPKAAPTARAWREIDLAALRANALLLQRAAGRRCRLMAVVKADAYGHGAGKVAKALQKQGVRAFAVASLAEGIRLRCAGVWGSVLILGYTAPAQANALRFWRLTQTITDAGYAKALSEAGPTVRVHLALDTGMHRLGIPAEEHDTIRKVARLPHLHLCGTFSHLCVSDQLTPASTAYTARQMTLFYDTISWMRSAGLAPGKVHIQASYGAFNLPPQPCDYLRAGIALYGVYSDAAPVQRRLALQPVLTLRARVAAVRTLHAGESAGYGLMFTAQRETQLLTVAIGYADGLPRGYAALGGCVLLHGKRLPVVGLVCMDQLLVDATDASPVQSGDIVTVFGKEGGEELPAQQVAAQCGMITNELLAGLGSRLGLVYRG